MDFTAIKANLEALGYKISLFENAAEATQYLASHIKNTTVGIGGSITAKQMGLGDALSENNDVRWHWFPREGQSAGDILEAAKHTEVYISSVNAIAETGEIVNIDGTGNRVAATIYGHKKVYFVIGKNKIAKNEEQAIWRARNIASPLNARRLEKKTPCAVGEMKSHNCKSPQRICRSINVFWTKPGGCEYEILLINEDLGY